VFKKIIEALSTIDVVVHAAGTMASGPVGDMETDAWLRDSEVNVKGSYVLAHEYLKVVSSGTFIFLGTLGVSFTMPGMSPSEGRKLAALKLAEFLEAEKPDLGVFTVHPSMVDVTETGREMAVDALAPQPELDHGSF
jgi:NAD(P)-dependent dehydrogenase (short-subunit alcohol dehydrogenase family)